MQFERGKKEKNPAPGTGARLLGKSPTREDCRRQSIPSMISKRSAERSNGRPPVNVLFFIMSFEKSPQPCEAWQKPAEQSLAKAYRAQQW
jgi:hypothetical protein